jgi:hypothetical protein
MRKNLIILLTVFLTSVYVNAQNRIVDPTLQGLYKFSDEYFRSDPFKGQFSDFLKHLINDPIISEKSIQKKTDTSLYTFFGVYNNYNPFFFKPKRLEILLQESSLYYSDSTKAGDTMFLYQLIAYLDDTPKGREELSKEFEKIHRQTKRKFFDTSYKEVMDQNKIKTAWHNYFVPYYSMAPASVIWSSLAEQKELVLNITLRFKMSRNEAILPMPLYRR